MSPFQTTGKIAVGVYRADQPIPANTPENSITGSKNDSAFDARAFRRALGNFATGVTIVTAQGNDGTKVGVTASSFNSLSMEPPLILWSCIKESMSSEVFKSVSHFAVNILASDQVQLSNHFARQQEDKFADVEWHEAAGGAPLLPGCAGRLQCETHEVLDGGDHWLFIGKVIAFDDFGRAPLCFHQGSYSVVFNHPGSTQEMETFEAAGQGRMGNHTFFLMLQAVRAYQDRYQPKVESLGLSLIESRTLLVVNDLPEANAERLVVHLNSPVVEVLQALHNLSAGGLIVSNGAGYQLTKPGLVKADECWQLADAHAVEAFQDFSDEEVENFKDSLRQIIGR